MAAREFHGQIFNNWDMPLYRVDDHIESGEWQDPWYPSKIPGAGKIEPQHWGEWRSESDWIMTGTSGWARWAVSVLEISEGVAHFEYVQVNWSIPFNQLGNIGGVFDDIFSKPKITFFVSRHDPDEKDAFAPPDPRPTILELVPWRRTKDGFAEPTGEAPGQSAALAQGGDLISNLPEAFFPNMSLAQRPVVPFTLRRRQIDQSQSPVKKAEPTKGIIYAVTPVVKATRANGIGEGMSGHPASGGDLMWAHHLGNNDGSFKWEGALKKVGTGWGGIKNLFSGGDGIIYGITQVIDATNATGIGRGMEGHPVSGGDLMWANHLGREHGIFNWEGPKKVGSGWGTLEHVFSGGDGIIYAITSSIKATLATGIGPGETGSPSSGGDLWWYRHVGRDDGTFRWEGPKKIGTGWGGFKHVFSGGNGIIYAITPNVEASYATGIGGKLGAHPASGGDLLWYHHLGWNDGSFKWAGAAKKVGTGWGNLQKVFSGSDGVIYAITQFVGATLPTGIGEGMAGHAASGGDLMWTRHLGRDNGSFKWESPFKIIGTGWGEFEHVFSGD